MTVDLILPENADGVIYALGGAGGGLVLYMDKGKLVYVYNMMIIEQYSASSDVVPPGNHQLKVVTHIAGPGKQGTVSLLLDGKEIAKAHLERTVPAAFSASETFDVGVDLGSTVSLDYADRRPFEFNGRIDKVVVELK